MKKYNANTYRIYKSDVKDKVEKINPDIEYCKLTKEELTINNKTIKTKHPDIKLATDPIYTSYEINK